MKKILLTERFQQLAGIKPLYKDNQNEIFGLFDHFMEKEENQKYGFKAEDMGGYIPSSDPEIVYPRSFKAAATEAMAVPQMPIKCIDLAVSMTGLI